MSPVPCGTGDITGDNDSRTGGVALWTLRGLPGPFWGALIWSMRQKGCSAQACPGPRSLLLAEAWPASSALWSHLLPAPEPHLRAAHSQDPITAQNWGAQS
jgi:hypothetical protein